MATGTIKAVVSKSDVINNLTTNDSTKVLSAAQGKVLNDKINQIATSTDSVTLGTNMSGNVYLEKAGNIVCMRGSVTSSSAITGNNFTLFTLPSAFRPSYQRKFIAYSKYATYDATPNDTFDINPDGTVKTRAGSGTFDGSFGVRFNISFAI